MANSKNKKKFMMNQKQNQQVVLDTIYSINDQIVSIIRDWHSWKSKTNPQTLAHFLSPFAIFFS